MPRAKAVVAPRAGVARAGRASHPTRGAAANKSYFGQEEMDEEMDVDGYEEGDTTLVNPGDSGDEEEEPVKCVYSARLPLYSLIAPLTIVVTL